MGYIFLLLWKIYSWLDSIHCEFYHPLWMLDILFVCKSILRLARSSLIILRLSLSCVKQSQNSLYSKYDFVPLLFFVPRKHSLPHTLYIWHVSTLAGGSSHYSQPCVSCENFSICSFQMRSERTSDFLLRSQVVFLSAYTYQYLAENSEHSQDGVRARLSAKLQIICFP
jgi:hypothetical protein